MAISNRPQADAHRFPASAQSVRQLWQVSLAMRPFPVESPVLLLSGLNAPRTFQRESAPTGADQQTGRSVSETLVDSRRKRGVDLGGPQTESRPFPQLGPPGDGTAGTPESGCCCRQQDRASGVGHLDIGKALPVGHPDSLIDGLNSYPRLHELRFER
jgi:hypothetical protein